MILAQKTRFGIPREGLKLIAMVLMVLDHAYMIAVTGTSYEWMTSLGRLAFPIFAFLAVEGYTHTHDRRRHLLRLLGFAIVTEPIFNLMIVAGWFFPFHQNVLFTLCIALALVSLNEKILAKSWHLVLRLGLVALVCLLGTVLGFVTMVDYFGFGVLTVLLFALIDHLPTRPMQMAAQLVMLWVINGQLLGGKLLLLPFGLSFPEQGLAIFSLIFLWLYNGKKVLTGRADKVFQYFHYLFYPGHILLLYLISVVTR